MDTVLDFRAFDRLIKEKFQIQTGPLNNYQLICGKFLLQKNRYLNILIAVVFAETSR